MSIIAPMQQPPKSVVGKYSGYTADGKKGNYDWRIEMSDTYFFGFNINPFTDDDIVVYDALNPTNRKRGTYNKNGKISAFGITGTVDYNGTIRWSNGTYWLLEKREGFNFLESKGWSPLNIILLIIVIMFIIAGVVLGYRMLK